MKFFFPDSHDLVDTGFDFLSEKYTYKGSRQQNQCYAHELINPAPYDGMLVSIAMAEGRTSSQRYTFGQVQRLKRRGIREFLRLDSAKSLIGKPLESLGDCGSFTYRNEDNPPYSIDELITFYEECCFDLGISLDHVILGYQEDPSRISQEDKTSWKRRLDLTLQNAAEFFKKAKTCRFEPIGAAQGWNPETYAHSVKQLQKMGYTYIALGGMVPLKTAEILRSLEAVNTVKARKTRIHLLGVTRLDAFIEFKKHGVYSIDSTSPLIRAFKEEKKNYYTQDYDYTAIRIPQVDGNAALKARVLAGKVDGRTARLLELESLSMVRKCAKGKARIGATLDVLDAYEKVWDERVAQGKPGRRFELEKTLKDKPWENCKCAVCREVGIETAIFRGAERNRRRGFHNLYVFYKKLQHLKNA